MSSFNFVHNVPPDIYKSHLNKNTNDLQTRPLWSTKLGDYNNLGTKMQREYYEIEIQTNKTEDDDFLLKKNMDDILNMNKYMCHICNIKVPRTYVKEHNNSIKHKTCSAIANLALERTKLQIQLDTPISRKVEILETYFCDPCSTVIFVSEKENHEKSLKHKISLKHDEQLICLYKIYSDINNVKVLETDENDLIKGSMIPEYVENDRPIIEKNDDKSEMIEKKNDRSSNDNGNVVNVKNDSLTIENDDFFNNEEDSLDNEMDRTIVIYKAESEPLDNNSNDLKETSSKIDAIIAKYFHSTCKVDALNNIQENKNKNQQPIKEKTKKRKHKQNKIIIEKENEQNQNECLEENNNIRDVQQIKDSIEKSNKDNVKGKLEKNKKNKTDQHDEQSKSDKYNKEKVLNTENLDKKNKREAKNKKTEEIKNKKIKNQKECVTSKHHNLISETNKLKPGFSLVYYLKDISRRCDTKPIHTVEAITDNVIQITAINGDKIRVLLNNFHSFHMKSNDIYCKVCESPNVRRIEWHIIENEHRAKVMIAIHDLNGIRQLDDIWSHCILCNDLIKDIDFHLQTIMHKNKAKLCLFELGKTDTDEIDQNDIQQNKPTKGPEITNLMQQNNLVLTNKKYLKCFICDVIVNYNLSRVKQHIISFEHLNKIEEQQKINKLVQMDDVFYCIPCDANIAKTDSILHCNGKKHKKLLKDFLIKNGEEVENDTGDEIVLETISQSVKKLDGGPDSELICFVCNIFIHSIEEHTDTFEHKKMYYTYLESNKLNEIEIDIFFCIPCNTIITIDYLMSHCTSRKHRMKLNFKDNEEKTIDKVEVMPSKSEINTASFADSKKLRLKILYQFKEMTDPNKLLCIICDEEIIYSRKEAKHHISTLDHIVAFNLMMLWNKIKKRDDKYFCDICCLDMTYFSEISHILGKEHTNNLAKEPKGTVYEYDRTLLTHSYAMSHKVGDRFRVGNIFC